jgi:hypothetical protein
VSGNGASRETAFPLFHEILGNVLWFGEIELSNAMALEERGELCQIIGVGEARVLGKAAFDGQVIKKGVD